MAPDGAKCAVRLSQVNLGSVDRVIPTIAALVSHSQPGTCSARPADHLPTSDSGRKCALRTRREVLIGVLAIATPWLSAAAVHSSISGPPTSVPESAKVPHETGPPTIGNKAMNIQAFKVAIDGNDIADLKRRIQQTRWPSQLDGSGWAQGMDATYLKALSAYWVDRFDWRRVESELNSVPQFLALTDVGSVHFVHLKSADRGALPIVLTHGWPSTFAELLGLGEMLINPTRFGASATDSFDVVIPSLPGYSFSSPPTRFGTNVFAIADQWAALMASLGYSQFLAHGGDIGAGVSTALGLRHSEHVLGLHLNYIPGSYQPYPPQPPDLTADEKAYFARRDEWADREGGYSHVQATKPDVLGPALNDSPVGLAAWIVDKFRSWSDCDGNVETRFTRDQLLTTISLYWFTRSMPSAIRLYWEGRRRPLRFAEGERVNVPVGIAHFPREIPIPPRSYVERGYNVTRWTEMRKGGHFAAMEEPGSLADDIRAFGRQFRPASV